MFLYTFSMLRATHPNLTFRCQPPSTNYIIILVTAVAVAAVFVNVPSFSQQRRNPRAVSGALGHTMTTHRNEGSNPRKVLIQLGGHPHSLLGGRLDRQVGLADFFCEHL